MVIQNDKMTVADLKAALDGMDGSTELPVLVKSYEYNSPIYSLRKVIETDEENEVSDAFILING